MFLIEVAQGDPDSRVTPTLTLEGRVRVDPNENWITLLLINSKTLGFTLGFRVKSGFKCRVNPRFRVRVQFKKPSIKAFLNYA